MADNSLFNEESVKNMVKCFRDNFKEKIREDDTHAEQVAEFIVEKMISDLLVEVVSDAHRSFKMGYCDLISLPSSIDGIENNEVVYPETVVGKIKHINCPKCSIKMSGTRFAAHLLKCKNK